MARYAIAGVLQNYVSSSGRQVCIPRFQASTGTSGDLVVEFDSTKFTSVAQLKLAFDELSKQLLGVGGLGQ
jgi:hypothetical protein